MTLLTKALLVCFEIPIDVKNIQHFYYSCDCDLCRFNFAGAIAAFVSRLPQTRHKGIGQLESPVHVKSIDK
jgi:hypothetical protein